MNLKSREKKIVAICVAVVLAAILHFAVISPSISRRDELKLSIKKAQLQLEELRMLGREYDQILKETKKIRQHMGGRAQDLELLPFLSHAANSLNLKNNLTSMKPSQRKLDSVLTEELVELRLEGISLENLVAYLHMIENTSKAVAVASIRIQPESKLGGGLNVSMLVTSITSTTSTR